MVYLSFNYWPLYAVSTDFGGSRITIDEEDQPDWQSQALAGIPSAWTAEDLRAVTEGLRNQKNSLNPSEIQVGQSWGGFLWRGSMAIHPDIMGQWKSALVSQPEFRKFWEDAMNASLGRPVSNPYFSIETFAE